MLTVILAGMVLNGTMTSEQADYVLVYLAKSEVPEGTHAVAKTVGHLIEALEEYEKWKNSQDSKQSSPKLESAPKTKKNSTKQPTSSSDR